LARGLVLQPEVLLCDEPFANVDTENQELIFHILKKINKDHGITIIFSSHDRPRAELLAHETWYLENGLLIETKRVNVIDAVTDETPGRYRLKLPGNEIFLDGPIIKELGPGKDCRVQLDPRKISLLPLTPHNRQTHGLRGTVLEIRQQEGEIKFLIDCATPLTVQLAAADYRHNPPLVGQQVLMVVLEDGIMVHRDSYRTFTAP
ncbi:MAG: hypothetical protein OEV64_11445, partial [Desulfobulbaceae bacterium]|nr:hypothetical protein [Desulfobulbaceae bacterium]